MESFAAWSEPENASIRMRPSASATASTADGTVPLETCSATTSKGPLERVGIDARAAWSVAVERDLLVARDGLVAHLPMMPHHAAMALDVRTSIAGGIVLERLPSLDGVTPLDAAERVRGLSGLVLLESARPGHRARWSYLAVDPVATLERPDGGPDPFRGARRMLERLVRTGIDSATTGSMSAASASSAASATRPGAVPGWTGGLAGYLSYDLGRRFERLPSLAIDDQPLPELRLGLYDLVVAWDRRDGAVWLVGRAVDGDPGRLRRRRRPLPSSRRLRRLRSKFDRHVAPDPRPRWTRRSRLHPGTRRRCGPARLRGDGRARQGRDRPGRDLPGQRRPPVGGPVRGRPMAGLSSPADG
jgi:hypothetical protein